MASVTLDPIYVNNAALPARPPVPATGDRIRYVGPPLSNLPTGAEGVVIRLRTDRLEWRADHGDEFGSSWNTWGDTLMPVVATAAARSDKATPTIPAPRLCARRGCEKPAEDGSRFCCDSCFIRENW